MLATFGVICMALAALLTLVAGLLLLPLVLWADRTFREFWGRRRKMIRALRKGEDDE